MQTPSGDSGAQTPKPLDEQGTGPDLHRDEVKSLLKRYWRTNVRITLILLGVWAVAGLGCGVLLADRLNKLKLPGTGFPLGFWCAQQGSIIVFVLLILTYCILLNRLDVKHHEQLKQLNNQRKG